MIHLLESGEWLYCIPLMKCSYEEESVDEENIDEG